MTAPPLLTADQVRDLLKARIKYGYSQSDMARELGCVREYVSGVMIGKVLPGPSFLKLLGLEKVTMYRRIGEEPKP